MTDPHGKAPTPEERSEEESKQESITAAQQQQQQTLVSELPELNDFSIIAQGIGAMALVYSEGRMKFIRGFEKLNDPHFEHNLLKVRSHRQFREIQEAYAVTRREVVKQREQQKKIESRGGTAKTYAEVSFGPFRKQQIDFADFDRKTQAYRIASHVQGRIDASELRLKIVRTANIFGLDFKHAIKMEKDFIEWQKTHKNGSFDDFFAKHGREIYRSKHQPDKKKLDKKGERDFRERKKRLDSQRDAIRVEAIQEHDKEIRNAQGAIKDILSPETNHHPEQRTLEQQEEIISQVSQGTYKQQTVVVPKSQRAELPQTPRPQFSLPRISIPTGRLKSLIGRFTRISDGLKSGIKSVFSKAITRGFSLAAKVGVKTAGKLGFKALGQAIGTALPGIGNAIIGVLQATGLDEAIIKFALNAAIFAVVVVVGVFFLMFLMTSEYITNLTSNNSSSAYQIESAQTKKLEVKWFEFEKNFLSSLDTNRHN